MLCIQFRLVQKQMAILLGRHQIFLEISDDCLAEHNANTHLHSHFLSLTRELDIMAPKSPEDIYKSHLEQSSLYQKKLNYKYSLFIEQGHSKHKLRMPFDKISLQLLLMVSLTAVLERIQFLKKMTNRLTIGTKGIKNMVCLKKGLLYVNQWHC